jgi:hypothetical protein
MGNDADLTRQVRREKPTDSMAAGDSYSRAATATFATAFLGVIASVLGRAETVQQAGFANSDIEYRYVECTENGD